MAAQAPQSLSEVRERMQACSGPKREYLNDMALELEAEEFDQAAYDEWLSMHGGESVDLWREQ